jgi:prepilin-type N-terminal cleavage/methylation domain-containing protein
MSPTSGHNRRGAGRSGFTLVEVMVATSVSAIVFAGIITAYLFVGRNLTRLVNLQQQEVESRRTLRHVTQDLSAAIQLTTATSSQVVMTKPTSSGTTTVTYTYTSGTGKLARTDSAGTQTLLSGVTAFTINYYNESGTAITSSPHSVKAVEFSFTAAAGTSGSGTLASYTTVSPRVLLRNKTVLQ